MLRDLLKSYLRGELSCNDIKKLIILYLEMKTGIIHPTTVAHHMRTHQD